MILKFQNALMKTQWLRTTQLKDPTKVDANNNIKFLIIVIEYPTFKKLNAGNYFKLLNLYLAKMLISNLNLKDLNEVYWRDTQVYFKDYIVRLLLKMQESKDYGRYFWDVLLSKNEYIEKKRKLIISTIFNLLLIRKLIMYWLTDICRTRFSLECY